MKVLQLKTNPHKHQVKIEKKNILEAWNKSNNRQVGMFGIFIPDFVIPLCPRNHSSAESGGDIVVLVINSGSITRANSEIDRDSIKYDLAREIWFCQCHGFGG